MERKADRAENKAEGTNDTVEDKAGRARDKMRSRTERVAMNDTRSAQEALKTQG